MHQTEQQTPASFRTQTMTWWYYCYFWKPHQVMFAKGTCSFWNLAPQNSSQPSNAERSQVSNRKCCVMLFARGWSFLTVNACCAATWDFVSARSRHTNTCHMPHKLSICALHILTGTNSNYIHINTHAITCLRVANLDIPWLYACWKMTDSVTMCTPRGAN